MSNQGFDGSESLLKFHRHLQLVAGYGTWMNGFKPTDFVHKQFFELLLKNCLF